MTDDSYPINGQVVVTGTGNTTGHFKAMHVVAAAVVSAMQWEPDYTTTGNWTSLTSIPANVKLEGRFSALTLASGQVVLHKV